MYGSGEVFSTKGTVFSGQLLNLYTKSIGSWAYIIIATAALATMFSTTLTCLDAYSRVLKPTTELIFTKAKFKNSSITWLWLITVVVGALVLIGVFAKNMTFMVDLATTVSFVTAPVLAYLNLKAVTSSLMPKEGVPPNWLIIYAYVGLLFLSIFSIVFLYWRFIM